MAGLKPIPLSPVPICWAATLGDCSLQSSCEHILSKALLEGPLINIRGLPFLGGKAIELHKNQFKSNILCRRHNNLLSQVDVAGISAFDSLRDAESENPRQKNKINGSLFERWLLKTMINIEMVKNFDLSVPVDLVEMSFGKRPFGQKAGLFFGGFSHDPDLGNDRVSFSPLTNPVSNEVCGAHFNFRNCVFLLFTSNYSSSEARMVEQSTRGETLSLERHPRRLAFRRGNFVSVSWRPLTV